MRILLRFAALAGLSTALGASVCRSVYAHSPEPRPRSNQASAGASGDEKKEPTFEETKRFILNHTSLKWKDEEGDNHVYTLTFTNKKLKFTHEFTSDFIPGYSEKMEVKLIDLDPTQVGRKTQALHHISLTTTNEEAKISIETTQPVTADGPETRTSTTYNLSVPGSNEGTPEEQDKMSERLKKAWGRLIKLAGGKPGSF